MREALKKHADKFRFGLVGAANTIIDFSFLFIFTNAIEFNPILSNFFSTSIAFIFSFIANKKYSFKSNGDARREIPKFLIVTLFGLWIIQPIIISLINNLLINSSLQNNIILLISKIIATAVTLVWNYVLYSRFVFDGKKINE